MNLIIRRRRFGQMVIVSAATTAIANFAGKSIAQSSQSLIGVRFSSNTTKQSKKVSTDVENSTPPLTLVSLDFSVSSDLSSGEEKLTTEIPTQAVDNKDTKTEKVSKAIHSQPSERITGLAVLSDGTIITATVGSDQKGNYSKLLFTDKKSPKSNKSKKVSGFKKSNSTIEYVVATKDDKIISVVSQTGGPPPFELVLIDPKNGKVTYDAELKLPDLPPDIRFSNLALAPDGTFFATTLDRDDATTLVQLDPQRISVLTGRLLINKLAQLTYNKEPLPNDLLSLTFSPSGQLIALARFETDKINSLLAVDRKTGEMTLLSKVAVDKIAFTR
jgi:hypothetical protein